MIVPPKYDLIIKNTRLVRPGKTQVEKTDIGIKDGKIIQLGADLPAEWANQVEDAKGLLAFPGLVDAHMHVEAPWWYQDVDQTAYIAYGVTTVRDMGESLSWVKALADRANLSDAPIPRYAYPGNLFQGKYDNLSNSFTLIRSKSQVQPEIPCVERNGQ